MLDFELIVSTNMSPVLYKRGPRYYHASYVVLVRTVDDTSDRVQGLDTHGLQGHYRIAEASKKVRSVDKLRPSYAT